MAVYESCGINLGGTFWIANDLDVFLHANHAGSRITVGLNVPIVALRPVEMRYFALAYQFASVEFREGVSLNGKISAANGSHVWRGGSLLSNGLKLPGGIVQADPRQPGFIY